MSKRPFLTEIHKSLATLVSFGRFVNSGIPAEKRVVGVFLSASPTVKRVDESGTRTIGDYRRVWHINLRKVNTHHPATTTLTLTQPPYTMGPGPPVPAFPVIKLIILGGREGGHSAHHCLPLPHHHGLWAASPRLYASRGV